MKNLFLTIVLCIAFASIVSAQKSVECTTDIDNVTVYLQGAGINSTAKASVGDGQTEVVFKGLPNSLNPKTIQLSAANDIVILSVSTRLNYIAPRKEQEEIKKLQDSIENLNLRISKINNRRSVLNGMADVLSSNKEVGGANVGMNPDNLAKLLDYYNEKMMKIKSELLEIDLADAKLKKTLAEYNQQMNEKTSGNKSTMEVVALVSSKAAETVNFTLNYLVTSAGWTPEYDLRGDNISSPVKLTYKANVWQTTGISWDKVKLRISTGNPTLTAQGPVFTRWYYDYTYSSQRDASNTSNIAGSRGYEGKGLMDSEITLDKKSVTGAQYTTMSNTQLSTVYDIDIPYTIPDDSKMHTVIVQEKTLPAQYKYYSIPKVELDAFLIARVTDWESLNLLSANANVFFEGAYVGQTYINATSAKDTLDISMGRDKKIIIKRTKVRDYEKSALVGDKVKKSVEYEIEVKNTRADKVDIDIYDQIPLTTNAEISVDLIDNGGATYDKETGKLTWNFKLNPTEDRKVRFAFSVKYPKAKEVYCPKF